MDQLQSRTEPRWSVGALANWAAAIFARAGLPEDDAALAGRRLLLADEIGVRTHGLARLPSYWKQLVTGGIKPRPDIVLAWRAGSLVAEADLGLGQVVAPTVLQEARRALGPKRGLVSFLIRDAGHLGALGTHLIEPAEAGLVAFLCQVTQPVMSPPGATAPAIGNNPIAFAAPRPGAFPLLFDFAASRVARGKIHIALRDGNSIEPGWAIGPDGEPTDDPQRALAGSILPAADHKGLALAMMVEVLAGALAGARPAVSADGAPGGVGAFGFLLDPAVISGADPFASGMRLWIEHYRAAAGRHARLPGDQAGELRLKAARDGLELAPSLLRQLGALGAEADLAFPGPASTRTSE